MKLISLEQGIPLNIQEDVNDIDEIESDPIELNDEF